MRSPRTRRRLAAPAVAAGLLLTLCTACSERPETHHRPGTGHEVATGPAGTLLPADDAPAHERLRQVPQDRAPGIRVSVRADSESGWNIRVDVSRFRFTPDSAGGAAVLGKGHAHLLVDGRKVARLYGGWHHLPAADVPAGARTVTVRLVADDHTTWAVRGHPVEDTVPLPGASAGESTPAQPPKADRTLEITVSDGKVNPAPGRVELRRGQSIALRVTSDTDDELHIHGVDRSAPLRAGRTTTLHVVVDRTGLFEVETHRSQLVLTQIAVR
ncbi:hypothetical protein [Streptomyces sp. bgisy027]|uniref:hypothetical protein n=1 Tax=unclassified Streptomyces TaxID=2593676 RepID=UPI003D72230B